MNRREFLVGSGVVLGASAVRPTVAGAQAQPPRGHIIAGLSERMLTLDPANHYSISATSVLRHVYDPLLDVTNDDKFVPALAERKSDLTSSPCRLPSRVSMCTASENWVLVGAGIVLIVTETDTFIS